VRLSRAFSRLAGSRRSSQNSHSHCRTPSSTLWGLRHRCGAQGAMLGSSCDPLPHRRAKVELRSTLVVHAVRGFGRPVLSFTLGEGGVRATVYRRRRARFLDRRMLEKKPLSSATRLMRCVTTMKRWVHCSTISYHARARCGLRCRPAPLSLQEDLEAMPEPGFVLEAEHRWSVMDRRTSDTFLTRCSRCSRRAIRCEMSSPCQRCSRPQYCHRRP
jgi:hypothetical protein